MENSMINHSPLGYIGTPAIAPQPFPPVQIRTVKFLTDIEVHLINKPKEVLLNVTSYDVTNGWLKVQHQMKGEYYTKLYPATSVFKVEVETYEEDPTH
jgi:hypothetical protein